MPIVQVGPYPQAEEILQAARVICNDAAISIDGDLLSDQQPYVFPALNLCYQDLQKRLIRAGVTTYSKYIVIPRLTPVQNPNGIVDTTIQVQLTYNGYFDGVNMNDSPVLPVDLLKPLELWERQSGTENVWKPMAQASDSISTRAQVAAFNIWDWETDILYLPGATVTNDLKMKYLLLAPPLTDPTSQVLVMGCQMALANLLVAMVSASRGGDAAAKFDLEAEKHISLLISPEARREQYANFQRKPFRARGRRR